jgi:hypothetical protein
LTEGQTVKGITIKNPFEERNIFYRAGYKSILPPSLKQAGLTVEDFNELLEKEPRADLINSVLNLITPSK